MCSRPTTTSVGDWFSGIVIFHSYFPGFEASSVGLCPAARASCSTMGQLFPDDSTGVGVLDSTFEAFEFEFPPRLIHPDTPNVALAPTIEINERLSIAEVVYIN